MNMFHLPPQSDPPLSPRLTLLLGLWQGYFENIERLSLNLTAEQIFRVGQ